MDEWKRSLVRIWNGRPNRNGVYQGTAFFIAPGYLITAKHVVESLSADHIYLQSDTGAWIEGGLRQIQSPVFHPTLDVAVLPLLKAVPEANVIALASLEQETLRQGQTVTLAGYSTPEGGLEAPELQISAYHGDYDLEVIHTAIEKGMSGGPALLDGRLVGITRAKDATHTYLVPLRSFRDFAKEFVSSKGTCTHLQPITLNEFYELKSYLDDTEISEEKVLEYFELTNMDLQQWQDPAVKYPIFRALNVLSKSQNTPPDEGPLFEFLAWLKPSLEPQLTPEKKVLVETWLDKVATRLHLDLTAIGNKLSAKSEAHSIARNQQLPVLILKVEAKNLVSQRDFIVRAWLYHDGLFKPQEIEERDYQRFELEALLPRLIGNTARLLGMDAKKLQIEFVLPIPLFGWNVNGTMVKTGPLKKSLGTFYPLVVRSWERIYHNDYDFVRHRWPEKWSLHPNSPECLEAGQIRALESQDICCDNLYNELVADHWVFVALFSVLPTSPPDKLQDVFGTMLAAGLPFAFWSLSENISPDVLRDKIQTLVCSQDSQSWPNQVLMNRIDESKQAEQDDQIWSNTVLLWDNPERLPPDTDYVLMAPTK